MLKSRARVVRGLKTLAYGVASGLLLYISYGFLLPIALSKLGLPIKNPREISFTFFISFLIFFISIESVANALKGTVYGFIFKMLSKLVGLLLFITVLKGGVIRDLISISGMNLLVTIDLKPIVAAVVLLTFPFIILDFYEVFKTS